MTQRSTTHKLLLVALGGVLLVTALVCGIGLNLTIKWYRNVQGILLQAEERAARVQLNRLEDEILNEERRALALLVSAGPEPSQLEKLRDHAFLRDPFFVRSQGSIHAPHLDRLYAPVPEGETERIPPEFENAWRLSRSDEISLQEKLAHLTAVAERPELSRRWRVRASLRVASVLREAKDSAGAIRVLHALLGDHGDTLPSLSNPSILQIHLAILESLAETKDKERIDDALHDSLRLLESGSINPPLEEELFFLHRASDLMQLLELDMPESAATIKDRADRRRRTLTEAENLRDRLRSQPQQLESAVGPQRFSTRFSKLVVPTIWQAMPDAENLAAGFQLDLLGLKNALQGKLTPGIQLERLSIEFNASANESRFLRLGVMPGELSFISIGVDRSDWEAVVANSRRPFLFAGVLISLLGIIVLIAAIVLFRGLRREFKLSKMKTEFVANVSHELKTPLALIRLCGETLLLGRVKDAAQSNKYLEIVTRESVRLGHLIANMLNFSSIEAGKKTYTRQACDLSRIVRETMDNYRFHLEEKGFEHELDAPASTPTVMADAEAVAQALINLLQNAVLYSKDDKHISVQVQVNGNSVAVSVSDRGIGISAEDQSRIWEDYFRTGTARAKTRGSGLGLSLVRHIMKSHDGRVDLSSEVGQGSKFTLVFPIRSKLPKESNDG